MDKVMSRIREKEQELKDAQVSSVQEDKEAEMMRSLTDLKKRSKYPLIVS